MVDVYSCHAILTAPLPTRPVRVVYTFIHNDRQWISKSQARILSSSYYFILPFFSTHSRCSLSLAAFITVGFIGRTDVSISMSTELDKLVPLRGTTSRFLLGAFNGGTLPVMAHPTLRPAQPSSIGTSLTSSNREILSVGLEFIV